MSNVQRDLSIGLLLISFTAHAQHNTAELTGNVTDANGAVSAQFFPARAGWEAPVDYEYAKLCATASILV